jgi:hypothetical protein
MSTATTTIQPPRFFPGKCYATPGALAALEEAQESPAAFLDRHCGGDWGTVNEEDKQANENSLADGSRILSAYRTFLNVKLWIITEAENDAGVRETTTILLPEEY